MYTPVVISDLANSRAFSTLQRLTLLIALGLFITSCAKQTSNPPQSQAAESTIEHRNIIPEESRVILEHADQFELLSLNPKLQEGPPERNFHGYLVLGKTLIRDAEVKKHIVSAFERGVAENEGVVAACFNPRHGIRANYGGRTSDFVICFECRQVQAFGPVNSEFLISASPQQLFDQILRAANVLLPGS